MPKYRVWCTTDSKYEYVTVAPGGSAPSVCPSSAGHVIDAVQTTILSHESTYQFGLFKVADLPAATAAVEGCLAYVTDDAGGKTLAFCDGTSWRRVHDLVIVSTS